MKKKCKSCGKIKPYEDFAEHPRCVGGRNSKCRSCKNVMAADHYQRNKDIIREKRKGRHRKTWTMQKYGLPEEKYQEMYAAVDGRCQICNNHHKTLCVDHDHATGKIRGLLCTRCNFGLGNLKDDVSLLNKAIIYLQNASSDAATPVVKKIL